MKSTVRTNYKKYILCLKPKDEIYEGKKHDKNQFILKHSETNPNPFQIIQNSCTHGLKHLTLQWYLVTAKKPKFLNM